MKTFSNPADRDQILARVAPLRPDTPALWGRMNAAEMLCHLSDSFRTAFGERQSSSIGGPIQRTVVKWIALYLPLSWPKNIPTRPENDPQDRGTRPGDFAADLDDLRSLCERFALTRGRSSWGEHPLFGAMSDAEWHRWGYIHMDHHLRQFGL